MTLHIEASAPGKLVLSGEYAVLEQGPAVAAAVGMRARVSIEAAAGEQHELHVANTGVSYAFRSSFDGPLDWLDDPGEFGTILTAASRVFGHQGLVSEAPAAARITLSTQEFYRPGPAGTLVKSGIGSSGAITVALTGALCTWLGVYPEPELARAVHHEFQGAEGSGIDVLTSWHGGVITMTPAADRTPQLDKLALPPGLQVLPVWTGMAASTPAMLQVMRAYAAREPAAYASVMRALTEAAEAAAAAWRSGQSDAVLHATAEFARCLKAFDERCGIGVWSPEHVALQDLADNHGVVYKPSGAGGGDYGVALATDAAALTSFAAAASAAGFDAAGLDWGASGLEQTVSR